MSFFKHFAAAAAGATGLMAGLAWAAPVIIESNDANALADALIGSGVTRVGEASLTVADSAQAGTFIYGAGDIGLKDGVVLSSGDVNGIVGTNSGDLFYSNDFSSSYGGGGDADLMDIVGTKTYDAAVLEFDFEFDNGAGGDLFFSFVFASEEYLEFVDTAFNDVFGFFVDDVNVALVDDDPISVNTINPGDNADYFVNNPASSPVVDLVVDGLTTAIVISVTDLAPGLHSMKFAIADTADGLLDSAIFIGGGSFSSTAPTLVPVPAAFPLMLAGLAGLRIVSRSRKYAGKHAGKQG